MFMCKLQRQEHAVWLAHRHQMVTCTTSLDLKILPVCSAMTVATCWLLLKRHHVRKYFLLFMKFFR